MRVCAKMRCEAEPAVTVALAYITREVVIEDLASEHAPDQLDLCAEHVERMAPPRGWTVRDERRLVRAAAE
jgi:hypothetical protein